MSLQNCEWLLDRSDANIYTLSASVLSSYGNVGATRMRPSDVAAHTPPWQHHPTHSRIGAEKNLMRDVATLEIDVRAHTVEAAHKWACTLGQMHEKETNGWRSSAAETIAWRPNAVVCVFVGPSKSATIGHPIHGPCVFFPRSMGCEDAQKRNRWRATSLFCLLFRFSDYFL